MNLPPTVLKMSKPKQNVAAEHPDVLFGRVVSILEQAQGNVVRAVNTNMVLAYWLIGREIVQELQGGEERAAYGKKVVEELSARLTERYGKGFSEQSLQNFRRFFLAYSERVTTSSPMGRDSSDTCGYPEKSLPVGVESSIEAIPSPPGRELLSAQKSHPAGDELPQGFSPHLSWSHYRALMRVENVAARDFYEREASECGHQAAVLVRV